MRNLLYIFIVLPLFLSCSRMTLEDKAKEYLPTALEKKIKADYGVFEKKEIYNLKTIYANDSICLLQCRVNLIKDGKKQMLEYRYIYLIDMFTSKISGKMVFSDCLMDVPCMPDELIKKSQEEVIRRNESVYDYMYSLTFPIEQE